MVTVTHNKDVEENLCAAENKVAYRKTVNEQFLV